MNQIQTIYGSGLPKPGIRNYEKVLGEFLDLGGREVVFSGGGEPLLNPNFVAISQASADFGFRNHLYTNGLSRLITHNSRMFSKVFSTIRISVHAEYLLKRFAQLRMNIDALTSISRSERTSVHLSFLVDTFPPGEEVLKNACNLISFGVEAVEIRSTRGLFGKSSVGASHVVKRLREVAMNYEIQVDVRTDGIDSSPESCFAAYSTVVIDPFFNLRMCCMRAHLGVDDAGNIADLFRVDLAEALALSTTHMRQLGGRNCLSCSSRLRTFSNTVSDSHGIPLSERNK